MAKRVFWGFMTLSAFCWLAGCDPGSSKLARPVDLNRDATDLVAEAVGYQAMLTSLAGNGVLALADSSQGLNVRLNAEVVASEGERLRVSGGKMGVHAFDLVMYGNDVVFHDARAKRVYEGGRADLDALGLPMRPDEILRHLLRLDGHLAYQRWRSDPSKAGDPPGSAAFRSDDAGQPARILLEKRTGLVLRVEYTDAYGRLLLAKTLGNWRLVGPAPSRKAAAAARPPVSVYPYMQRLEWPAAGRKVEFTFSKLDPNAPLSVEEFSFTPSDKAKRMSLREADVDPGAF